MSLPAVTARLYASDEVHYFSYLRSLYFDRDVSFENEYRYFYDHQIAQSPGFHELFLQRETDIGRRVNFGTMGCAVLWLPFYATADAWTRLTGGEANGFTQPYISAVAYGSAFYGFLAILLSVRAARTISSGFGRTQEAERDGRDRSAIFAGAAVWIGTPLLFYMYVAPPFSHACSAFAVALFINVWLHVRRTWSTRGAFALGLSAALMGLVREQDVFIALGPAVDFALSFRPRLLAAAVAGVAGTALGYAPQLLAYNALNGYPGPAKHVSRKMYWYAPHALQVLGSPEHGFLVWTPLAILAIAGLFVMLSGRMRIALCLLIMVASQVYVAGSVESWSVAGAFGQRRFVSLTPVLVIGLAGLIGRLPSTSLGPSKPAAAGRRVLAVAIALCVWWNIALMAQFATKLMDRQRLELHRNAYHAFVTLPLEAPSLVYRYLTKRESFYSPPAVDR